MWLGLGIIAKIVNVLSITIVLSVIFDIVEIVVLDYSLPLSSSNISKMFGQVYPTFKRFIVLALVFVGVL